MLQEKIIKEIEQIPKAKLAELYDVIHHFRLELEKEHKGNPTMQLAGAWADMDDGLFPLHTERYRTATIPGIFSEARP